ncbi:hypothetical protein EK21DRAFT_112319 [Setomelanomma holmii]|uniref:Uncharacterized protein n=1 Tax=Setomelanomma holmii TaxID=210430 RepID=A0A9P4H855_9PLEO|nr:hypothetical protein EK21DRAFT_112319 [Setomelanomma holmii]
MAPRKPDNEGSDTITTLAMSNNAGSRKRQYKKVQRLDNGTVERRAQNQRDSPLLKMPPEIRNRIYDFALGGLTFRLQPNDDNEKVANETKSKNAIALLAVCRQLYAETAVLPTSLNVFSSHSPIAIHSWTNAMRPANRASVTNLKLSICIFKFKFFHNLVVRTYVMHRPDKGMFSNLPSLRHIQLCLIVSDLTKSTKKELHTELTCDQLLLVALLEANGKGVKITTEWVHLKLD